MMRRDFNNDKFMLDEDDEERKPALFKRRIIILITLILLLGTIIAGWFYWHKQVKKPVSQYLTQAKHLFDKKPLASKKPALPNLANSQTTRSIQFEFYETLPTLNVAAHENAKYAEANIMQKRVSVAFHQDAKLNTKTAVSPFNAEALEKDFSQYIKNKNYIIQIGLFNKHQAALTYLNTLQQSGLRVQVVKVMAGKTAVYRIQQGPFSKLVYAKSAQKKLQQKGIVSLVRQV